MILIVKVLHCSILKIFIGSLEKSNVKTVSGTLIIFWPIETLDRSVRLLEANQGIYEIFKMRT